MKARQNNYEIQTAQAQKRFLMYDQQELINRSCVAYDMNYFYMRLFAKDYRLCRSTGHLERRNGDQWADANSFAEVMIVLDWLCDCSRDRWASGRYMLISALGNGFHQRLQDQIDPAAVLFDQNPQRFCEACLALGGEPASGADVCYSVEFIDGLRVLLQLWHADEEFAPRLCCLFDENTTRYIRYETVWYAQGLLKHHLQEYL